MTEFFTTGTWKPNRGEEDEFVEAWTEFAHWAAAMPGAGALRLMRDLSDPGQFVSFGDWESIEAVREWKGSPEFKQRMGQVQRHVDEFSPGEFETIRLIEG